MTIKLPPDVMKAVRTTAAAMNTTVAAIIEQCVRERLGVPAARRADHLCYGCKNPLTEYEFEYYENRLHIDRLCKRCTMEERAR